MKPITSNLEVDLQQEEQTVQLTPDKSSYLERIHALPAEDQAFMDGYLFAKVTEAAKQRGA